jgi:hypothetical protein
MAAVAILLVWASPTLQQLLESPLSASASSAVIRSASYTVGGCRKVPDPLLLLERGSLISRLVCALYCILFDINNKFLLSLPYFCAFLCSRR